MGPNYTNLFHIPKVQTTILLFFEKVDLKMKSPEDILIYVGTNNKTIPQNSKKPKNVHPIGEIRKHPGFEENYAPNDIAILNLKKPIKLVKGKITEIPMMEAGYTLSKYIHTNFIYITLATLI